MHCSADRSASRGSRPVHGLAPSEVRKKRKPPVDTEPDPVSYRPRRGCSACSKLPSGRACGARSGRSCVSLRRPSPSRVTHRPSRNAASQTRVVGERGRRAKDAHLSKTVTNCTGRAAAAISGQHWECTLSACHACPLRPPRPYTAGGGKKLLFPRLDNTAWGIQVLRRHGE